MQGCACCAVSYQVVPNSKLKIRNATHLPDPNIGQYWILSTHKLSRDVKHSYVLPAVGALRRRRRRHQSTVGIRDEDATRLQRKRR